MCPRGENINNFFISSLLPPVGETRKHDITMIRLGSSSSIQAGSQWRIPRAPDPGSVQCLRSRPPPEHRFPWTGGKTSKSTEPWTPPQPYPEGGTYNHSSLISPRQPSTLVKDRPRRGERRGRSQAPCLQYGAIRCRPVPASYLSPV